MPDSLFCTAIVQKYAPSAQNDSELMALGFGNSSRQGAKSPSDTRGVSSRTNVRDLRKISLFVRNDKQGFLRVPSTLLRTCFAGDIPRLGCGSAALGSVLFSTDTRPSSL
jgi:hypothetical protein